MTYLTFIDVRYTPKSGSSITKEILSIKDRAEIREIYKIVKNPGRSSSHNQQ